METRQYWKATKALLVLIPLLGLTYLVVMAGPNEGVGKYIFAVIRALLISTQVYFVCGIVELDVTISLKMKIFSGIFNISFLLFPEFGSEANDSSTIFPVAR